MSCQYPILEIQDLSSEHPDNDNNNTWHVIQPFPTKDELLADEYLDKNYLASAWVRESETLLFHVKFTEGSHMAISWKITSPNTEQNDCETGTGDAPAELAGGVQLDETENVACIFPFRYDKILYYGCTWLGDEPYHLCATETDPDYNALKLGVCNEFCQKQRKLFV